jgi:Rrf2 family iron-sulfur cluster assembly transcriptional regulator
MLSVTAQHALRALAHLASLPDGETVLGRDLARQAGIPANYLSKILWALGSAGIIDATRGSGGGYRLGRRAEDIRLFEVVDLFDKARAHTGCLLGPGECTGTCPAHEAWRRVGQVYTRFLGGTTVADIARRRTEKKKR